MDAKLKECPFCGATARIESNRDWHRLYADHREECVFDSEDETLIYPATPDGLMNLVECWNLRAIATPVAAGSLDTSSKHDVCRESERFYRQNAKDAIERAEKAEAERDTLKESLRLVNVDHGLWMARTHAAEDARDDALDRVKELEAANPRTASGEAFFDGLPNQICTK